MSAFAVGLLRNLAMGQALVVAPALGESYAGKSAGTISALLLMIAADLELEAAEAVSFGARLAALLASARPTDAGLAAEIDRVLKAPGEQPQAARWEQMLDLLVRVHAWADDHDPRLAADCREFLADWAGARRLHPPAAPAPSNPPRDARPGSA